MEDDKVIERNYKLQKIYDAIYRFFYNIWPSINKTLNFFFYYLIKILKGFVKIAVEQFRSK